MAELAAAPGPPQPLEPPERPRLLVAESVSLAKLDRQVQHWRQHEADYRRRGLLLVRHDGLEVDLLVLSAMAPLPTVTASVRLTFDNYDLWPPSLLFTEPMSGEPLPVGTAPLARAWDVRGTPERLLMPGLHPATGRVFLCVPGVREYHSHSEHGHDHWLRYRGTGPGTLDSIATTLHKTIGATALSLVVQTTLGSGAVPAQVGFAVLAGRRVTPSLVIDLDGAQA